MPRAQVLLFGVVWITYWASLFHAVASSEISRVSITGTTENYHRKHFNDVEWSSENLVMLKNLLDEHVSRFKAEVLSEFALPLRSRRSERARERVPTITGMTRVPSISLNGSASQLEVQKSISCFTGNSVRYCILGGTIFMFKNGTFEPFLSGLPVGPKDLIKTYVFDDAIFMAIYNKKSPSLRLYIVKSPGWKEITSIQPITAEVLEDCIFFESDGALYMALAIQLGTLQYAKPGGMQCVIYKWLGTTVDTVHSFQAPGLQRLNVMETSDSVFLVLLYGTFQVQLRKFTEDENTELLDIIELKIDQVYNFDTFLMDSDWHLMLSGSHLSLIYRFEDQRLLKWQTLFHRYTNNSASWMRVQQRGTRDRYNSTILIFNPFDSENKFEYYVSDSSYQFSHVDTTFEHSLNGTPVASLALLDDVDHGYVYIVTRDGDRFFLEGFTLEIAHEFKEEEKADPLVQCLSDVNLLISKLDTSRIEKAEKLVNNLIHYKDNFTSNGTLVIKHLNSTEPPIIEKVKVLFNFSDNYTTPREAESKLEKLQLTARSLSSELPDLFHMKNTTFSGNLTFSGPVTSNEVRVPSASIVKLNDRIWDDFVLRSWRYSSNYTFDQDFRIGSILAKNVTVGSTVGGATPSRWLLREGGEVFGKTTFANLHVRGNIEIASGKINGIPVENLITKNESEVIVKGYKTIASVDIENNVTVDNVNERDFETWVDSLVLQQTKGEQRFTGFVRLKGPVHVAGDFNCDWFNGINVSSLPEVLVDKTSHQVIEGPVHFISPLLVADAEVDTINGALIENLLSTSGQQTIRATIEVDVLDIKGNLQSPDINGQDVSDFVFTDEEETQVVQGPLHFEKNLTMANLNLENGTLNGLNVTQIMNPDSLRIDSQIQTNQDFTVDTVHVKTINGVELSELRSQYWTKSTDQNITVNVRMPFEVIAKENITTKTFMDHYLDRDFFFVDANETFNMEVVFTDDVVMLGDLVINDLKDINGVMLQALDGDVVKKEGEFQILGYKTFEELIIQGNLVVEETFNNFRIPEDIALLNNTQTLTGLYFSSDVTVDGDVLSSRGDIILNTVAGVLLDDFVAAAAMIDEDADIDGSIHFERHLDVDNLFIENLNGHNVNELVYNGLRKNHSDILDLSKLIVHGDVTFMSSVDATSINSYNVDDYLSKIVNMTEPDVITGTKKTSQQVVALNATFDLFNGIPLNFSNMLTISDNQTISGEYVLQSLTADTVNLRAINGQNLSDYVKTIDTNETQIVSGGVVIEKIDVAGPLQIEDQILNGCNLTQYRDVRTFTQFDSLSIQNGTLLLEEPIENNPDLATISLRALRIDQDQVVTGNVAFVSDPIVNNLDVLQNQLGSVDLEALLNNSMLKSVEQNVSGTIKYQRSIEVLNMEHVNSLNFSSWNGDDVQAMIDQVVLKTGNQTIRAEKFFVGDLNVTNNLEITGTIDNVPATKLVKKNEFQFPAKTKFTSLVIKKELNVTSGMIDGVNLTSLLEQRVPLKGNYTVKSNLTFENFVTTNNIVVKTINNLNMSDVVLRTSAPNQAITGKKHLRGVLDINGDILVETLNGRNPEEMTAYIVLKDQDAEFQKPMAFLGGLTVTKNLNITTYNRANMSQLIADASTRVPTSADSSIALTNPIAPIPLLQSLQQSTNKLTNFEFFEQIQQIPFISPHGSNLSIHLQFSSLPPRKQSSTTDTAAGILVSTHSIDGESCKLSKSCRCHRSMTLPSDTSGRVNSIRMPTRLKDYMEDNLMYGDRVRLLPSQDYLFIFTMESQSGCLGEKVAIAVVNPFTFKLVHEKVIELNDTVADIAVEQRNEQVVLVIGQKIAGALIYLFDGDTLHFSRVIDVKRVVAIDMISHRDSLLLAVASYGFETVSSIWNVTSKSGPDQVIKNITTVGATDVLFTKSDSDVYVTFAQDPSAIDTHPESRSQFKAPVQVLLLTPSSGTFDVIQHLDIDRVVTLANLDINGDPFMAVANFTGVVRIYRLIQGQGFQAEQTFKNTGVKSIAGYSIRNQTFLATITDSSLFIFVARVRGPQKPIL